jgi:DNA invertase Pin-like site-specific DNA recombinase
MKSVIYTRVSSKEQVDKYSLPAQENILRERIVKEGDEFIDIYTDAGISGETIEARPEFSRLLLDAQQKKFDAVWVIDQDRLSRGDLGVLTLIKKIFRENNILICTPSHKISLNDIDSDLMSNIFGAFAQFERLKFIQRANRGRQVKAERGEWGGRTTPYGYSFDMEKNKHLVINEEEAKVYRLIVHLFLDEGLGIKRIATELNNRVINNHSGKAWKMQAIHYILRNPTYKGTLVHQKFKHYKTKEGKNRWRDEKIFTEIPNAHPALVSDGTFRLIQERLEKKRNCRVDLNSLQLLTGILECTSCHNTFKVGSTGGPGYRHWIYRCKTRFAHWFDKAKPNCSMKTFSLDEYNDKAWRALQNLAKKPELIQEALQESSIPNLMSLDLCQKEYRQVVKKLEDFQNYKDKLVSLHIRQTINEDEFKTQLVGLIKEKNVLEQQKRGLAIKIEYLKTVASEGINKEAILRYAKFIYQSDKKLTISQKRRVLEAFVNRIPIYGNGEFELVCKFHISPHTDSFPGQSDPLSINSCTNGGVAG